MVAKVCMNGGELWLGPVPTEERLDTIIATPMHIQIGCFKRRPTEVWVDGSYANSKGLYIPDAEYFKLEMSNYSARQKDFRKLRTTVLTSLRQGDNAYVHCMTGLARAPMAASLLVSLLMDEDIDAAMHRVDSLRNVQFDKAWRSMGGTWMDVLVNEPCTVHAESDCYLASMSRPTATVIHAGVTLQPEHGLPKQHLCKWKRQGYRPGRDNQVVLETPEEARNFSSSFCQDCLSKLAASRRAQVKKAFDTKP